jgi:hypothetical protein
VLVNKVTDNVGHGYKYRVFRYKDAGIAQGAADRVAVQAGKAFRSLFKRGAECYNRTAYNNNLAAIIPFEADSANPAKLYGYLKSASHDWTALGDL